MELSLNYTPNLIYIVVSFIEHFLVKQTNFVLQIFAVFILCSEI